MPNNIIKSYADKTNKSISELEIIWDKAVDITREDFNKSKDKFGDKEWSYTTSIFKKMVGVKESFDILTFINSDLKAKDYIKSIIETQVSTSFPSLVKDKIIVSDTLNKPEKDGDDKEDKEVKKEGTDEYIFNEDTEEDLDNNGIIDPWENSISNKQDMIDLELKK